eukprot:scaffold101186_cov39-Attheya_sp.AAC.1
MQRKKIAELKKKIEASEVKIKIAELNKKLEESEVKLEESEVKLEESEVKRKESEVKLEQSEVYGSVEDLLAGGMPSMVVNNGCIPSITNNEKAQKIVSDYRSEMLVWDKLSKEQQDEKGKEGKPKRFDIHEPAKISSRPFSDENLNFALNLKDSTGRRIKSMLLIKKQRTEGGMLNHYNKTSPQDYLAMAIEDVIWCSGFPATVVKEATLFALRPDLIVVFYEGRVLFVVE